MGTYPSVRQSTLKQDFNDVTYIRFGFFSIFFSDFFGWSSVGAPQEVGTLGEFSIHGRRARRGCIFFLFLRQEVWNKKYNDWMEKRHGIVIIALNRCPRDPTLSMSFNVP